MVERIYIARHGFRLSWQTNDWTSPTGLAKDYPLAAYGHEQAVSLAKYIANLPEDRRPTLLFSSPYSRCLQTSTPAAEILGLPILVEHGLSEWYSPVVPGTGLHPRPYPAKDLLQYFPLIDTAAWDSICYPDRRGETIQAVHTRCTDFLDALISRIEKHPTLKEHKNIMLVSHAATSIALVHSLLKDDTIPLRVGTCTVSTIERGKRGGWEAVGTLADGSFLEKGVERDWGFEDVVIRQGEVVEDPGVKKEEDPGFSGIVPEPEKSRL
ncbi:phosphoglycerate mutase-like protein [Ceratobasidium sp. AG-I]|nr:phosphoglycerate mutase-like protein [Ceratobasidium sp. AG-I]